MYTSLCICTVCARRRGISVIVFHSVTFEGLQNGQGAGFRALYHLPVVTEGLRKRPHPHRLPRRGVTLASRAAPRPPGFGDCRGRPPRCGRIRAWSVTVGGSPPAVARVVVTLPSKYVARGSVYVPPVTAIGTQEKDGDVQGAGSTCVLSVLFFFFGALFYGCIIRRASPHFLFLKILQRVQKRTGDAIWMLNKL